MKIDSCPFQVEEANLVERVDIMMVEIEEEVKSKILEVTEQEYEEKTQAVYPQAGEYLVDFLHRCKIEDSKVMLCPRCNAVFDKKAAKSLEQVQVQKPKPKP